MLDDGDPFFFDADGREVQFELVPARPARGRGRPRGPADPERAKAIRETLLLVAVLAALFSAGLLGRHHLRLPGLGTGDGTSSSVTGNALLGQRLAARDYGWTGGQWTCLNQTWTKESGWSNTADTRVTGAGGDHFGSPAFAYGVPEARAHGAWHGSVQAPYPAPYQAGNPPSLGGTSSARAQIKWGLWYVKTFYVTPCGAWSHEQSAGWY